MENNKDTNRFSKMAEVYDKLGHYLVPQYHFLQDEVIKLIEYDFDSKFYLVDLGAGSGIFLEKVLQSYPNAQCYWIDSSEAFLNVANNRLNKYKQRITFILSPIEEHWEEQIKEDINVITSMSAIHHLESHEKRILYERVYVILKEDGWFFNIDEMKTITREGYVESLKRWVSHGENIRSEIPEPLKPSYVLLKEQFDNWKKRNLDNINRPKTKGDDIHESFLKQIRWLEEIGFRKVDLFVKHHLWSVIGGQK